MVGGTWGAVPDETTMRWQHAHMRLPCASQAYRAWLDTDHEFLFYVNNDVLVPDGVVDALARAMTPEGERCVVSSSRTQLLSLPTSGCKYMKCGHPQRNRRACMSSMLGHESHCIQHRSSSDLWQAGTAIWSRRSPPSRARGTGARWRAWSCSSTCRTRATTLSAAHSTTAACRRVCCALCMPHAFARACCSSTCMSHEAVPIWHMDVSGGLHRGGSDAPRSMSLLNSSAGNAGGFHGGRLPGQVGGEGGEGRAPEDSRLLRCSCSQALPLLPGLSETEGIAENH